MAKKSKYSMNNAKKQLNIIEEYYAKIISNMSGETRLKIFRKLASLLKNRFSLMDALDRVEDTITNGGKNPDEPMAVAVRCWQRELQNGKSFSDALNGWAPSRERLMLSVGDVSDMESALLNLIKVSEGSTKMIRPVVGAVAYPLFLLMMAVLMLYGIGAYMVPPMVAAAPGANWTGVAGDLVAVSEWIIVYWPFAFSSVPITAIIIYTTLGIWTGKIRATFDAVPPWSLYRVFTGVCWLLALAALVKGGTSLSIALRSLRADSSKYLRERIDTALIYINSGYNLGEALYKTGLGFPDHEIIGDLKIYSELDNFEDALDALANEWLEESIYSIGQRAAILNMGAILAVGGVIAWSVFGVFEMQDQITNTFGG